MNHHQDSTGSALVLPICLLLSTALPVFAGGNGGDCNDNGVPDNTDITNGTSADCNENGVPDECDIADGTSADCNGDGIPDDCLEFCPPVDVVFVFDTSGSMTDDSQVLCANIGQITADVMAQGVVINSTVLGIIPFTSPSFPCISTTVAALLGAGVPGNPGPGETVLNDNEDWGPATAVVADRFSWTPGALRLIIPISDEAPENGGSSNCNAADQAAIDNAIMVANNNGVVVSPIAASGSIQCVIDLGAQLADATGGQNFVSRQAEDLTAAVVDLVLTACANVADCNENGIPDQCDLESGTSDDCDDNGVPDECEGFPCDPVDLGCLEFNRFADLTPKDTLTVITNGHNPEQEQGYMYAIAVDAGDNAIGFDYLIGALLVVDGLEALEYSVNPLDFRAAVEEGAFTDQDGDGVRDLNGLEYEKTAGEILVPRFLGTDSSRGTSGQLILLALSGGPRFSTTTNLLVYNDDEDQFSSQYTFDCWDKVRTTEISMIFENQWLDYFSGQNPQRSLGNIEYGWFKFFGSIANSNAHSILDPAVHGVYIERIGSTAAADLPFERCTQSGHLLPFAVNGDNEEASGTSDQDCGIHPDARHPASLLLFPEFDNRNAIATVVTVTNTNSSVATRVHFVYRGKYGR